MRLTKFGRFKKKIYLGNPVEMIAKENASERAGLDFLIQYYSFLVEVYRVATSS